VGKLTIALSGVSADGCVKPECGLRTPLNRHHKRHEALWFNAWAHRQHEPKWQEFVKRYHEFRPEDTVVICLRHHAEIHSMYDRIIQEDRKLLGLPLYRYSWKQGTRLMDKLEAVCEEWLKQKTKGIDSAQYDRTKKLRRRLLKNRERWRDE